MSHSPTDELVNELAYKAKAVTAPLLALELQWDLEEDDRGHAYWILELHAIIEASGWDHSRFSTTALTTFPAESIDERHKALRLAQALAERCHLPLHAPPLDDKYGRGGQGGSAWIRNAGTGPEAPYLVQWDVEWWTDEGVACTEAGTQIVNAVSGEAACRAQSKQLEIRFRSRPLRYRTYTPDSIAMRWWNYCSPPRPPIEEIREIAFRETGCPSRIAHAVVTKSPDMTTLSLMVAFERSFHLWIDSLGSLARWRSGELSDAELDAELAPRIENQRPKWDGPRVLRSALTAGRSVAACIREKLKRGERTICVARQLREAFDIDSGQIKLIISLCAQRQLGDATADETEARKKDAIADQMIEKLITASRASNSTR